MTDISDKEVINKFREMVGKRYTYDQLVTRFSVPHSVTEEMINEIKVYFLESIYPEASKRFELEEAFAGLGSYVRSPRQIWGLLGNMTKAIFTFGRQFPAALSAGMKALDAFLGAKNFESEMVQQAAAQGVRGNISDEDFEKLMSRLPKQDIEEFIRDVRNLFKIMTNTVLIHKTIDILDNVVSTMRRKPHIYPKDEVDGILLGRDILVKGFDLFSKYDEPTKQLMVDVIYRNEIWFTDYVFEKWKIVG